MSFLEKLLRSKGVVWTLLILPGLWAAVPFLRQDATVLADPLKYLLHHFGFVASVILAVVLTFSPLRVLLPKSRLALALNRHRRLVGVAAFAYALLHLATHVLYEGGWPTFAADLEKPFLVSGLLAFTILFVLTITSVHRLVRALGTKRWKNLHRLVYLAAALVIYHQAAARKIFPEQVLWIFGPLTALELARIAKAMRARRARNASTADAGAGLGPEADGREKEKD